MEPDARSRSVSLAHGNPGAWCAGNVGRDAVDYGDFWNGRVLGEEAAQGTGSPCRPWRTADGSAKGRIGAGTEIACHWFGSGTAVRNSCEPGAGLHRVPGDTARSAGVGGCCVGDGIAGVT